MKEQLLHFIFVKDVDQVVIVRVEGNHASKKGASLDVTASAESGSGFYLRIVLIDSCFELPVHTPGGRWAAWASVENIYCSGVVDVILKLVLAGFGHACLRVGWVGSVLEGLFLRSVIKIL